LVEYFHIMFYNYIKFEINPAFSLTDDFHKIIVYIKLQGIKRSLSYEN